MAIDTAEKRKSIAGIPSAFRIPGVTPNVVKDLEWRQESGWSYSGILTAVAIPADAVFPVPVTLHFVKAVAVELNSILRRTLTRGR